MIHPCYFLTNVLKYILDLNFELNVVRPTIAYLRRNKIYHTINYEVELMCNDAIIKIPDDTFLK